VYFSVPDFEFVNQDSQRVNNKTFENKIYIADFFFTHCPTICPIMKKNLLRVQSAYKNNYTLGILSHSIDTRHDSIPVLKKYSQQLHADTKQWHFVTGDKLQIYNIAEKGYYAAARPDSTAPGGYVHSGYLVLIDKKRHIRGLYDGTTDADTDKLIADIHTLMQEIQ
jgi:protein SCO1/2